jgi:hypothetical protein
MDPTQINGKSLVSVVAADPTLRQHRDRFAERTSNNDAESFQEAPEGLIRLPYANCHFNYCRSPNTIPCATGRLRLHHRDHQASCRPAAKLLQRLNCWAERGQTSACRVSFGDAVRRTVARGSHKARLDGADGLQGAAGSGVTSPPCCTGRHWQRSQHRGSRRRQAGRPLAPGASS